MSVYSAIMAVIWFTAAALIGSYTLHHASRYGLTIVAATLSLSVLRIFLPLDLDHSIVIRSDQIYPFLQDLIRTPLIGKCTVGVCLLICWAAGSCFFLSRLVRKLVAQKNFRGARMSVPLPAGLLQEVSGERGYKGPITLIVSPYATNAYQLGFFRPYIILPRMSAAYSEDEIRYMVCHELCHFLSGDLWILTGLKALRCILWWHPAMYLLCQNAEHAMELRCDRQVCENLGLVEQTNYLETLKHILIDIRPERSGVSMGCLGHADDKRIQQRFEMIMTGKARTASRITTIVGCLLCAFLFVASYFVILQPWTPATIALEDKEDLVIAMVPDDSYIVCTTDGSYKLFWGGIYRAHVPEDQLTTTPFNELPIIHERIDKE